MEKKEVRVKSRMELQRAAAYLLDVVEGLRTGKVVVEHGEEGIELSIPEQVTVQVKARSKEDKESIAFKVTWRNEAGIEAGAHDLRIASTPKNSSIS